MRTGVSVTDAMTIKPISVSSDITVVKCAKIMLKKKVGSLVVVKGGKLIGIITEKDIVSKVVAKHKDSKKLKAKNIMTKRPITIGPTADIFQAMQFMEKKGIRRLPVVSPKKELLGLLTIKDVLRLQPQLYDFIKEKSKVGKMVKRKQKYIEGQCESCGDYGQLYEVEGQLLCEDCKDEAGHISEKEVEEEGS